MVRFIANRSYGTDEPPGRHVKTALSSGGGSAGLSAGLRRRTVQQRDLLLTELMDGRDGKGAASGAAARLRRRCRGTRRPFDM